MDWVSNTPLDVTVLRKMIKDKMKNKKIYFDVAWIFIAITKHPIALNIKRKPSKIHTEREREREREKTKTEKQIMYRRKSNFNPKYYQKIKKQIAGHKGKFSGV